MKARSAKAKGRRFQQEVRDAFLNAAGDRLEKDDIRSNPMGALGEDLLFSPAARRLFPFSVECKNVEKLNIWGAIDQCLANCEHHEPLVAFKKNGKEAYVAIRLEKFLEFFNESEENSDSSSNR